MEATNALGALGRLDPAVAVVTAAVSLIVSIVLYALFVLGPLPPDQRGVRAFANFDRCVAAPFLKFCYLLLAVSCLAFGAVAVVAGAVERASAGAGVAVLGALGDLAVLLVVQVVLRVVFELLMLPLRLADDVHALRCGRCGEAPAPAADAGDPSVPADLGPSAAPRESAQAPSPGAVVSDGDPSDGSVGVPVARRVLSPRRDDPPVEACGREISIDDASSWESLGAAGDEGGLADGTPAGADRVLWDCRCGATGNAGAYCGTCGAPRESALRTY